MSLRSQRFSASFALKSYLTQRTQKIRREPLRSIFHSKYRVAVPLMTDLVDFFFASIATIEPVRTVDHDARPFPDVFIPKNNPPPVSAPTRDCPPQQQASSCNETFPSP